MNSLGAIQLLISELLNKTVKRIPPSLLLYKVNFNILRSNDYINNQQMVKSSMKASINGGDI